MGDNQKAFKTLLQTIANHSDTIWEFIEAMTPEYLRDSQDQQAVIARTAIMLFGK